MVVVYYCEYWDLALLLIKLLHQVVFALRLFYWLLYCSNIITFLQCTIYYYRTAVWAAEGMASQPGQVTHIWGVVKSSEYGRNFWKIGPCAILCLIATFLPIEILIQPLFMVNVFNDKKRLSKVAQIEIELDQAACCEYYHAQRLKKMLKTESVLLIHFWNRLWLLLYIIELLSI